MALALARPSLGGFLVVVVLVALWMAPNWLTKLLRVGEELRRYRERRTRNTNGV
jgi:hypothetical protein